MNLFTYTSYKAYIEQRSQKKRGELSKIAQASNCQLSYLSRALKTKIQITLDQAFKMCRYFQFDEDESSYFSLLVEWDRAGDPDYRSHLQKKLVVIRDRKTNIQKEIHRSTTDVALMDIRYHSHWAYLSVHVLINTGYNTQDLLVAKTKLPESFVQSILEFLSEHKLITEKHGRYHYNSKASHIPKNSPILPIFHNQWRQRAALEAIIPMSGNQHFTNVQSISRKDYITLERMLLDFIKSSSHLATQSGSEEVFALSCDLFKI